MAGPDEILKTYPVFKVAAQVSPDKEVRVQTLRVKDVTELKEFLRRLLSTPDLTKLSFLEIHQILPDGTVCLVQEATTPWPKKAPVQTVGGIIVPKIPKPETSEKAKSHIENQIKESRSNLPATPIGPATPSNERSELGRPLFKYTIEAA